MLICLVAVIVKWQSQTLLERYKQDVKRDATVLGKALSALIKNVAIEQGEDKIETSLKKVQNSLVPVRLKWYPSKSFTSPIGKITHREMKENFVSMMPVYSLNQKFLGAIELIESMSLAKKQTGRSLNELYSRAAFFLVLGVFVIILLVNRYVGTPINKIIAHTKMIADGELDRRLHLKSSDELSQLADYLNHMCNQIILARQQWEEEKLAKAAALQALRHENRLKILGRLSAGIAHEMGTPLNVISGRAGLIIEQKLNMNDIVQSASIIKQQSTRMTEIIRELLDFARIPLPNKKQYDLVNILNQTINMLSKMAYQAKVNMETRFHADEIFLNFDIGQLQQVFTNLILNAIHSMPDGGLITISSQFVNESESNANETKDCIKIEISDTGVGIEKENLDKLFEPFFTTKDVGEGTGLGLSIVYGIVKDHDGWLNVKSTVGQGSTFTIYLPLS
jgi:signal transduction histidine kinase